jgi:hypothetical protein
MSAKQSARLWTVTYILAGDAATGEELLILAHDAEQAARKAQKFLRERGDRGAKVESVKNSGTIDVF